MLMITKMIDDSDDDELVGTKQIKGEYDDDEDFIELSDDNNDDELVGTKQREQTCVTNLTDGFLSNETDGSGKENQFSLVSQLKRQAKSIPLSMACANND